MGKHHPDADPYIGDVLDRVIEREEAKLGEDQVWYCPRCRYGPIPNAADGVCPNCTGDALGRVTGNVTAKLDKEPRPQTRDDVSGPLT